MKRFAEELGYRMVSRFVPKVTAAAAPCTCEPGFSYCKPGLIRCTCLSNCRTISCKVDSSCRPG
jgi:hypothetical protein